MYEAFIGYFAGLSLVIVICFLSLLYYLLRSFRFSGSSSHHDSDLTNMMLLFQTMRDTLEQQKQLAQDFNASVDQKVGEIKKHIESTENMSDTVQKAEKELDTILTQAREELDSLRRRMDYLAEQTSGGALPQPEKKASPENGATNGHNADTKNGDKGPLRSIAEPKEEPKKNLIDQWVGLDIGAQEDDEWEEEVASPEEDSESGREAFRSLLNMQSTEPVDEESQSTVPPIQQRVYEYADAGMRVPEISRELGIGKGEVRLILSLRQSNLG